MKSVLISNNKSGLLTVYTDEILGRLEKSAGLLCNVYSYEDVIGCKEDLLEVEYIFSSWGMPTFSEDEIREIFPRLRCVFYAAGSVQSFARAFLSCGVRVFSAWAANAVPVAEYTHAQIILANKGFFSYSNVTDSKDRAEIREIKKQFSGNYGERVGIIGAGMIGSLVAEKLRENKLSVMCFDPFLTDERANELGVVKCSLQTLFSECRVISNHLANNTATKKMLNYSLFSLMRPHSVFINTGRGAQVVEQDLVRILEERWDIVALLDVTDPEPSPESHPFHSLKNCILTPHIAGSIGDETHRMAEYMEKEFLRLIEGRDTMYEVDMKMLETMA